MKSKLIINYEKLFLWSILAILLAITLYPLTQLGLLVGDDLENYYLSGFPNLWNYAGRYLVEFTGRFYLILIKWIYYLPYVFDNHLYYECMRIIPIFILLVLFFWLIKRITQSINYSELLFVFFCALFCISGKYSAFISYPFYFTFSFALILTSLHLLLNYFESKKYYYLLLSSFVFALSTLFYEAYLMYYPLFFILIIAQYKFSELNQVTLIRILKELAPYIFWGIAYLLTYFIFYIIYPSTYVGNQIELKLSPMNVIASLFEMAYHSCLPISSTELILNSPAFSQENGFQPFSFTSLSLIVYIKALLLVLAFSFLCVKTQWDSIQRKKLFHIIWVSFVFLLIPNLPIVISARYINFGIQTYITSDFVFLALLLLVVSLYFLIFSFIKYKKIRIVCNILIGFLLFTGSLIIQSKNEYFARDVSLSEKRFKAIAQFLTSEKIAQNDNIYVEPLHFTTSNIIRDITYQGYPLAEYIYRISGVEINQFFSYPKFYQTFKESEERVKIIYFSQAYYTGDSYIALISCKGKELTENWKDISVDTIQVGYLSPNKQFGISLLSDHLTEDKIENQFMQSLSNYNYANLYFCHLPEICQFSVIGQQLCPMSLTITNLIYPNLRPLYFGEFSKVYKRKSLKLLISRMKNSKEWMNLIEEKAIERNITVDEMLQRDAEWLFEEKWDWHSGKKE